MQATLALHKKATLSCKTLVLSSTRAVTLPSRTTVQSSSHFVRGNHQARRWVSISVIKYSCLVKLTMFIADHSEQTDPAAPEHNSNETKALIKVALRNLEIDQYTTSPYTGFLETIDVVHFHERISHFRCSGILHDGEKDQKRCAKAIDKDELARAFLGLQAYTLDVNIAGKDLRTCLDDLSIYLLHTWKDKDGKEQGCRGTTDPLKLGGKLYEAIMQFRGETDVGQAPNDVATAGRKSRQCLKVVREWYEANENFADLEERVRILEGKKPRKKGRRMAAKVGTAAQNRCAGWLMMVLVPILLFAIFFLGEKVTRALEQGLAKQPLIDG